jgi:hypothetical protein
LDYKTHKELADYLIYLSNNNTAYNQYFKWKKYASPLSLKYKNINYCKICIKLHLQSIFGIEYKSINLTKLYSPYGNCVRVNGNNEMSAYSEDD